MAEECSATSVIATSSPTPTNWWPDHAAASLSSWSWQNPTSSNCDVDDGSISTSNFTSTASNHYALNDVDSSRRLVPADFITDEQAPVDTHIWTHLLSSVGSNGSDTLQNRSTEEGAGIYEPPPFDYLKKMDNKWEFPSNHTLINNNNFNDKNLINGFNDFLNIDTTQRLTAGKLSNMVNNWSIAPPDHSQPSYTALLGPAGNRSPGFLSCLYGHDSLKVEDDDRPFNGAGGGNNGAYQIDRKYSNYYGVAAQSPCTSSVANNYSNSSRLTKPLTHIHESKPCFMPSDDTYKKQTLKRSSPSINKESKERNQGNILTNEGKKKRSDQDSSETGVLKKTKNEGSAVSSSKMQAPKVKLGDKITALQQIVSPFGKTDTASVLLEAIGYIKFLQEQVQLLSNPYMKTNPHKDPWGSVERKEKDEINHVKMFDLRSRGLCLVPISCTPQLYRENSGSDYWTPTYRGCLYR